tara:strand:- start:22829 stop:23719 length:891 start_codon:yes stop_codon:yes gene_type:complete
MNLPLVSIYMPTYNRLTLLKRAINSVIEQSYKNIELIVVNDGSSDNTREYLDSIASESIKIFHHESSKGACRARNLAIENAKGEFITGLDDDDYLEKKHIEILYNTYVSNDGIQGVFSNIVLHKSIGKIYCKKKSVVTLSDLRISNYVGNQIFTTPKLLINSGLFDTDMPAWQDYELWFRILAKHKGVYINTNIASYIQDESHLLGRISGDYQKIFSAFEHFSDKYIDNDNDNDKKILKLNVYYYQFPQFKMRLIDFIRYIFISKGDLRIISKVVQIYLPRPTAYLKRSLLFWGWS